MYVIHRKKSWKIFSWFKGYVLNKKQGHGKN